MEGLAALSDSAARMGGEPRSTRRALDELSAMVTAAGVAAAHISAARLDALESEDARAQLDTEREAARAALAGEAEPPATRLGLRLAEFVATANAYENAAVTEQDLH